MVEAYSSDHIVTMEGLKAVRNRPTQYIPTRDNAGQVHTAKEIIDNSNDELSMIGYGIITVVLFRNRKNHTYQLLISDTGRGIPLENNKFVDSLTVLNTSAKYSTDGTAYRGSGGLFGVGGKVPAALSTRFKAISKRANGTGLLTLEDGNIVTNKVEYIPNTDTGVTVIYELDPQFFTDIAYFMETGYLDIISLFRLWGIFSSNRYIFKICDSPINEAFWNYLIIPDTVAALESYTKSTPIDCEVIYDSEVVETEKYIYEYFNADKPITWKLDIVRPYKDENDRISYQIKLFTSKKLGMNRIGLINNIIPQNQDGSSHVKTLYKVLYNYLAPLIDDKDHREFFLSSGYRIPIFIAASVKYDGAELGGTTKDIFLDVKFERLYEEELIQSFNICNGSIWKELVTLFAEDLQEKFDRFYNRGLKVKNTSKLALDLHYTTKFHPCEITGPDAELFIVEGESASNIKQCRNSKYQAVYETRGKPKNFITNILSLEQSKRDIIKNKIYHDLIKIIGIDYRDPELTKLNYGKIILTMDADPDGAHIVSLHTGDIYALNPNLISKGFIWMAMPPLYTMSIGKAGQKKYLRDYVALVDTKINLLYNTSMQIELLTEDTKRTPMTTEAFRDFCYMAIEFGKKIEYSSKLLGIPELILERLAYGLEFLVPHVDMEKLNTHFGAEMVNWFVRLNYFPERSILVLSVGDHDYPISLLDLDKEIRRNLLPYIIRYQFKKWSPVVTSKIDPVNGFNKKICTVMQVYMLFRELDKLTEISRSKGLGGMDSEDVITTLIDKKTRSLYHISEIGQIENICKLMGDDSSGRKLLLSQDGTSGIVQR